MKAWVKGWLERALGSVRGPLGELHALQARAAWETLKEEARARDPRELLAYGYKTYSQGDEDGILQEVLARVGSPTRTFVEVGVGDGRENNTVLLWVLGWRGVWVEADAGQAARIRARFAAGLADGSLALHEVRVDRDCARARLSAVGPEPDVASVDIDGNDWHVVEAALPHVRARVWVVEYNAKFPPPLRWVLPYDPDHRWAGTDRHGASLTAWAELFAQHDYRLVACSATGNNAFFVRGDLCDPAAFAGPLTPERLYQPGRYWLLPGFASGHPPDPIRSARTDSCDA